MWVRALRDADASCGGKAVGLARLLAARLPVPEGFVITSDAFHAIAGTVDQAHELAVVGRELEQAAERVRTAALPDALVREVHQAASQLGGPFAVRSSATIEDAEAGAAAGVFSSRGEVSLDELWPAIRLVWESALTPLAAAYARGRALSIGVIVQRFIAGEPIRVSTRPVGAPTREIVWIQEASALVEHPRDASEPMVQLAVAAEAAIAAERGADVELVRGDALWLVQARPIVHPVAIARVDPPPIVTASLIADGRTWTWDTSHNPDPLSIAQADLVELVDRAGVAPWEMRVAGGYLYTAARSDSRRAGTVDFGELEAEMADVLGSADESFSLDDALSRYLAFYELWAQMSSIVAQQGGPRRSIVHAILSRGLPDDEVIAELSMLSPAWDVAVPTYGERPHLLRDAIARARVFPRIADAEPEDLGERDDLWFARAQLVVRRALLSRAAELGIPADDIFWIPLDDLTSGHELDVDDVRRRASAARNVAVLSQRWQMPMVVGGDASGVSRADRTPLQGVGLGPRVTGRVVRLDPRDPPRIGPGDVVVCSAVTPALAVVVIGCTAIVCETGGLLDHGAALAREMGITCVVDCHDAWTRLTNGLIVTVDGSRGTVEIAT